MGRNKMVEVVSDVQSKLLDVSTQLWFVHGSDEPMSLDTVLMLKDALEQSHERIQRLEKAVQYLQAGDEVR